MTLYSIKRQNWLAYVRFRCRRKPDSDNFPRPSWLTKTHDRVGSGIQDATPKQFLEAILLKILLLFQVSAVQVFCFVFWTSVLLFGRVYKSYAKLNIINWTNLWNYLDFQCLSSYPFWNGTDFCWNQK